MSGTSLVNDWTPLRTVQGSHLCLARLPVCAMPCTYTAQASPIMRKQVSSHFRVVLVAMGMP